MAFTLSAGAKNAVDTALGLLGGLFGLLATNSASLPTEYQAAGGVIGIVGGYAVSDILSVVDTGVAPPANVIATQVAASYSVSRPLIVAEIAKLPAADQNAANLALSVIDGLVAKA